MNEPNGWDLRRLRWIGVILPVAFIWLVELVRFLVLDPNYRTDTSHVIAALVMAGGVVVFAGLMSIFLDRAQRRLVTQNRDLSITHAVSSAVWGDLPVADLLARAVECLLAETDALAGIAIVRTGDEAAIAVRRPVDVGERLAWVAPMLDEPPAASLVPVFSTRSDLDSGVLDIPLARGGSLVGHLRLVVHPTVRPDVSTAALSDIGGKIAAAVQLAVATADLRRREREQTALYGVALQLTGRDDVRDVLQAISAQARELLTADRIVICLADPTVVAQRGGVADRIGVADDGSVCLFGHVGSPASHARNPLCPMVARAGVATMSLPLRGPDGLLGELCAIRDDGTPFDGGQRSLLGAFADMAAIAVRTARLRDAEEQWTILAERDRIARELHDSLAQVLGVIHLRARDIEGRLRVSAPDTVAELAELADVADEAYRDVREAILGLRETITTNDGLEGALRGYLVKYTRQTGIVATLLSEGETGRPIPPRTEVQLLRVVQEALTNVRKHAGATRVAVTVRRDPDATVLSIEDDGVGFDPGRLEESLDHGFGLTSMRERVEQVGGTLDVDTAPGRGTRVVVRLEAEEARVARSVAAPTVAR